MTSLIWVIICTSVGFCLGIVIGIYDCKRRFGIPKGEMPIE